MEIFDHLQDDNMVAGWDLKNGWKKLTSHFTWAIGKSTSTAIFCQFVYLDLMLAHGQEA